MFVGTTNKALYLRDETGNRRFWPVKTGDIKLDWLRCNRDQLLAEAVVLYRRGIPWWPDREFERQTIREEQEARYRAGRLGGADSALLWIRLAAPKRTTILDVALHALGFEDGPPIATQYQPYPARGTPINRLGPGDQQRIAAVLTHLKWMPKRSSSARWWEPI